MPNRLCLFFVLATGCAARTLPPQLPPATVTTADPVDARLHALYVPSCNEYLVAIRHCFEKGSPEARAALEKDLLVSADAWVLAARTPKGQNGLSVACTIATREIVRNGDKCPR